jgi:hypothetical protein
MALSRAKLQAAAKKAMLAAGDVVTEHEVVYVQITPGVYDPATGAVPQAPVQHTIPRALVTGLARQEMDWFPGDLHMQKIIIAGPDFPASVTPDTHDYFLVDGVHWEIVRDRLPPAGAVLIFFVRQV